MIVSHTRQAFPFNGKHRFRDFLDDDASEMDAVVVEIVDMTEPEFLESWVEDGTQTDTYIADIEYLSAPKQSRFTTATESRVVETDDARVVFVESETTPDQWYIVTILPNGFTTCTCQASRHRPDRVCKHAATATGRT